MGYVFDFFLAILLTALSYYIGSLILRKSLSVVHALIIGTSVVLLGAITEALNAPMSLIIVVPFPVGMLLLYLFLKESVKTWFMTYLLTLAIYTVFHIVVSYFFSFHSLIPAWKLS
ncbi:hypothetical protein [Ureibacillus sinduriensis]|uniref:Uncharacterized protein n=1 Tax=Ureibacillus sinduriensis BLB-1 = JCM 15800 TaxID=1384057 RepID=A0A0A3I4Z3_9BACL|nr:hypothetical protein [Ureibacillus sinduriensis]KGR78600.1 hypothetical protein CD33_01035 [Ureibacillus sinduriensis BLB-1 = JCM 15800]